MQEVELVLGLLVLVAALALLAHRLGTPYPIVLVLGGLLTGLVPGLPEVELAPELVFLLFLPPLVYIAAFFTSVRDFRAQARPILSLAVGLVLATTVVVAVVAHAASKGSTGRLPSRWARSCRHPMPWRRPRSSSACACRAWW